MLNFNELVIVKTLDEALDILSSSKMNRIIGGTAFLKMTNRKYKTLIDISNLGYDKVEENKDEFIIGANCSLGDLTRNKSLSEYYKGFNFALKSIVGEQLRNTAKIGASVFSRFGFSDIITPLLAVNTRLILAKKGEITLEEFLDMKREKDILLYIIIPKGYRLKFVCLRKSSGDFSVINISLSKEINTKEVRLTFGARPARAIVAKRASSIFSQIAKGDKDDIEKAIEAISDINFGNNMRASSEYRLEIAKNLTRRLWRDINEES